MRRQWICFLGFLALVGCGSSTESVVPSTNATTSGGGGAAGGGGAGGADVCGAGVTDGTDCGINKVCLGGQCVACTAGAACTPANECRIGETTCASGATQCLETSKSVPDGQSCGTKQMCLAGACSTCSQGSACTPTNPCHVGMTECSGVSPGCKDTNQPVAAGVGCGADQVCAPNGTCIACSQGAPCDPGIACAQGNIDCSSGAPICTQTGPASNGAGCAGGKCVNGACAPNVAVSGTMNISKDKLAPGRTCADGVSFSVTALGGTSATLSAPVPADCLAPDDLVMIINEQGAVGAAANVGNYEVLPVATVSGSTVSFSKAKSVFFGDVAGGDAGIGTGPGQQKVALLRVPVFGVLSVSADATLTVDAWDGQKGGVLAVRAANVTVEGVVTASAKGYRGGRWSEDNACTENVDTENGESISGPSIVSTAANAGGSGGLSGGSGISFYGDPPLAPSAGHATAGQDGQNSNGRTLGAAGSVYGNGDGTQLTMGSGAGGNLTCSGVPGAPHLSVRPETAGGIVAVFSEILTVSGEVSANGATGSRAAPSGGYVLLRGHSISLGAGLVQTLGGAGMATQTIPIIATYTNVGGDGYVVVTYKTALSGTSKPTAMSTQDPNLTLP